MKQWSTAGLILALLALVLPFQRIKTSEPINRTTVGRAGESNGEAYRPVQSRGKGSREGGSIGAGLTIKPVSPAAIADGDWIHSFPLAESHLVLWAFTNNGVSVDQAKGYLRPALRHLFAGAVYKDRIAHSDVTELAELKRIREGDEYEKQEKVGMMTVVAAAYQASRAHWIAEQGEWMEEFTAWVASIGVDDPEALKKDLLLIQPANPPPDVSGRSNPASKGRLKTSQRLR